MRKFFIELSIVFLILVASYCYLNNEFDRAIFFLLFSIVIQLADWNSK